MRSLFFSVAVLLASLQAAAQVPEPSASGEQRALDADAQPDEGQADHPGYREAFEAGLDEFRRGNYVAARAHFQQADTIWPNARTQRVLGYCAFELRAYVRSIALLQRALAHGERPLTDAMRAETDDLLRRARGYVATVTVLTTPADAHVEVDGEGLELDAQRAALLAVGPHAVEVHAPEHYPARREVQVTSGTPQTLHFDLAPLPKPPTALPPMAPVAAPAHDEPRRHQPPRKKRWLWAGVATVATAALVTGLAVGLRDTGAH